MYNLKLKIKGLLWILVLLLVIQACKKDDENFVPVEPVNHQQAEVTEVKSMGIFTPEDIQQLLDSSGTNFPFLLNHSVEAFSIKYYTIDHESNKILVSGALFVPQNNSAFPLLSIQHGTETKRDRVASVSPQNSTEGIIGLLTASMDYVTLVPDFPGFGTSTGMHPYLHAGSIVPSVIDFIKAGQEYCSENDILLKDKLFLTGYSEGGYVSLLAQKVIEESYQDEFDLTAVAPMSGPYDLRGMFDKIFPNGSYSTPAYVAYFLTAYNKIYGWNSLGNFFKTPYASMMPDLFDGTKSWGEIINTLPATLSELMHPDFITNYPWPDIIHNDLKTSGLISALEENTVLNWKPEAPVHFFHGDCDEVVCCSNATCAMNTLIANGAKDVQLTIIPGGNHESSGPIAINGALEWFGSFHPHQ